MKRPRWRPATAALAALLLASGLVAGCSSPAARSNDPYSATLPKPVADPAVDRGRLGKELNVFNWTEYLPEEVLHDFQELYGVKVNYDTYSSNEELIAKLKAGAVGYDVVFPSDYAMQILLREGLLQQIDHSAIPNLTNIDLQFRNLPFDPSNAYSVPYMWGTTGIVVNTKLVDPTSIKGWVDLWQPRFEGRLVVPDDARETIGMALRASGQSLNARETSHLDKARDQLLKLKPNIKAFNSDSPKEMLLSGEVWAGVVWSGEAAKAIQENPDMAYIYPEEGFTVWMDNVAVPRDAPHLYTAHVFINYLLDPGVSARLSLAYQYGNPNRKARELLPHTFQQNPAIEPPHGILERGEWLEDLGDKVNQQYDRTWTEVKSR